MKNQVENMKTKKYKELNEGNFWCLLERQEDNVSKTEDNSSNRKESVHTLIHSSRIDSTVIQSLLEGRELRAIFWGGNDANGKERKTALDANHISQSTCTIITEKQ